MGAGLQKIPVVVEVTGGIDTKTNARLVPSGALLELENMVMLKTGELRLRNGFKALSQVTTSVAFASTMNKVRNIFADALGNLCAIWSEATRSSKIGTYNVAVDRWEYPGKIGINNDEDDVPLGVTAIANVISEYLGDTVFNTTLQDRAGCDSATTSGWEVHAWKEHANAVIGDQPDSGSAMTLNSSSRQKGVFPTAGLPGVSTMNTLAPIRAAATQVALVSNSMLVFYAVNFPPGPYGIWATQWAVNSAGGMVATNSGLPITATVTDLKASTPWFDVQVNPGTRKIVVAYANNAGTLTLLEYDTTTLSVTLGPTVFARNVSQGLGFMENKTGDGNYYLAMAGTAGVSYQVFSGTTLASVAGPFVLDASATANVRNVTGVADGSLLATLIWEVGLTSAPQAMLIRMGTWTGSAVVSTILTSYGLASRVFTRSDGIRWFIATYDSPTQPHYLIWTVEQVTAFDTPRTGGEFLYGNGGGFTSSPNGLSSVWLDSAGRYCCALPRQYFRQFVHGTKQDGRGIVLARIDWNTPLNVCEASGETFLSGGLMTQFLNGSIRYVAPEYSPEPPVLVQFNAGGAGAMTLLATYNYVLVWKRNYNGKVVRSAPSIPVQIVMTGVNNCVNVAVAGGLLDAVPPKSRPFPFDITWSPEIYRAGPIAIGATTYNLVQGIDISFLPGSDDGASDAQAALGEILYTTGNVLENLPPPSCSIMETNGDRVWVISSEDTTELWPSKIIKSGFGMAFNPNLKVKVTGDGFGGFTALASMDGRLIAFKSSAIYVISGDGPDDTGQGTFNKPQAASISNGTTNPKSIVRTQDGIMFESVRGGIWLLDRSLNLSYIGSPVEQYTLAESVAGASLVNGVTQARFIMPSGRCLVWDYFQKHWYTFKLFSASSSPLVACANTTAMGWCYANAIGNVYAETPGLFTDPGNAAIIPKVSFPHLALSGIAGYQRIYYASLIFEVIGNCTVSIDAEYDYGGAVTGVAKTQALVAGSGQVQVEYIPPLTKGKSTSFRPVITSSHAAGSAAFRLTSITVWVGTKRGSGFPFSQRLT